MTAYGAFVGALGKPSSPFVLATRNEVSYGGRRVVGTRGRVISSAHVVVDAPGTRGKHAPRLGFDDPRIHWQFGRLSLSVNSTGS